jgi:hypothetical protein
MMQRVSRFGKGNEKGVVVGATRLDCGMMTSKQDVGRGVDPVRRHARQVAAAALERETRAETQRRAQARLEC